MMHGAMDGRQIGDGRVSLLSDGLVASFGLNIPSLFAVDSRDWT